MRHITITSFSGIREMSQYLLLGIVHVSSYQMAESRVQSLSTVCRDEGRFPHPQTCRGYVECVVGGEGSDPLPLTYTCPGGVYHPRLARCIPDKQAPWCRSAGVDVTADTRAGGRGIDLFDDIVVYPVRSPTYDRLCVGDVGFACASCMQSVVCADGEAFLLPCPSSTRCVTHASFAGGVCYPDTALKPCGCSNGEYVLPDPYNPAAFLLCQSKDRDPEVIICSDGFDFDPDIKTCVAAPAFPPCAATGSFSLQDACRWFYTCVPTGSSGWQQVHGICPSRQQMYSQVLERCIDPNALPQEDHCSKGDKVMTRYTCSFWQLLYVFFFPHKIATICSS